MPKEVSDIKQFIEICKRKDASCKPSPSPIPSLAAEQTFACPARLALLCRPSLYTAKCSSLADQGGKKTCKTAARIKRNRKTKQIKFKVRCHRFLYTLVLKESDKADKLKQSLPPSTSHFSLSVSSVRFFLVRLCPPPSSSPPQIVPRSGNVESQMCVTKRKRQRKLYQGGRRNLHKTRLHGAKGWDAQSCTA